MLPIFRVLPVGGVFLAILILLMAATPPNGAPPAWRGVLVSARGPLIDSGEHPEWRSFIVQAAFRRAEAVIGLRDLPSPPTKLPEIVVPMPDIPPVAITAAADATAKAALMPSAVVATVPAAKPEQIASLPPRVATQPATMPAAKPPMPETRIAVPLPAPAPGRTQIAAVPSERPATDPSLEEVTGSIDAAAGSTMPIEIGETSSTELPIVLPPERPKVMRYPAHAKAARAKRRVAREKPKPQAPPQNDFFSFFSNAPTPAPSKPAAKR